MIKIAFFIRNINQIGGTEIATINLCNELCRTECIYIFCLYNYVESDKLNEKIIVRSLFNSYYESIYSNVSNSFFNKVFLGLFEQLFIFIALVRLILKHNINIIVNQEMLAAPAVAFCKCVCNTVMVIHWSIVEYFSTMDSLVQSSKLRIFYLGWNKLNKIIIQKSICKFSKVVVLVSSAKDSIVHIGVKEFNIINISNPLSYRSPSKSISSQMNDNYLFVGRLTYEKGVDHLLKVWKIVESLNKSLHLNIVGNSSSADKYLNMSRELNLKNVRFLGAINSIVDLDKLYLESDLLILPSRSEGFGLVIIEAAYRGVPTIAFDVPISPKEVIADAGIIIPPFDHVKFASEIVNFASSEQLRKKLSNKAVNNSSKYLSTEIASLWKILVFDIFR